MFLLSFFLSCILLFPLICCLFVNCLYFNFIKYIRFFVGLCFLCEFFFFIVCIILFDNYTIFNFIFFIKSFFFSTFIVFGVDYVSLFFLTLTAFINCICVLFNWSNFVFNNNLFFYNLLLLQSFILNCVFFVLDLLVFYIFFEFILITLFVLIGFFGSRNRKIRAGFLLFLYTLLGSILLLLSIIYFWILVGNTCYFYLLVLELNLDIQLFVWFACFFSFAVKVPILPFHVWLPEAHVEAPTIGSVLLAGILLKLGTYGFFRFSLILFPQISYFFIPFIFTICLIGIYFSSMNAMCQTDVKRIIAYSSIAHMNLIMLGLFSFDLIGISGCFLQMLNHGIVSGGLFLAIGFLYDQFHTRLIKYFGGLFQIMPIFAFFFLILILANIAIPGTCSFIGEFLIFLSLFNSNFLMTFLSSFCMVLGGIYSLWLFNKIFFGNLNIKFNLNFIDLDYSFFFIFIVLCLYIVLIGFCSYLFLNIFVYNFGFFLSHICLNVL